MKLRHEVLKSDVEAALQVLNFAIYHKELTEMEEREQREMEMKQQADLNAGANGGTADGHGRWFYNFMHSVLVSLFLKNTVASQISIFPTQYVPFCCLLRFTF
uniref:Uncharacterized protein n=1 Tax=Arundo donax TaxID=35708 RepID=A0A0A9E2T0_ARUDO